MAKATAVTTVASLLANLEKSKVVSNEQLATIRKSGAQLQDPRELARRLIQQRTLTRWQARQLLNGYCRLTIGKYKLVRQLGRGELGRVFLAEHPQLNRQVALKVLSSRFTKQQKFVRRFLAEARAAAALDHRNIIHVYDVDCEADRYYLVMEYAVGTDLQTLTVEHGPQPLREAASLILQAAAGLAHAHKQGMTHRDLKPANLLLDAQGVVKVLDVGVGGLVNTSRDSQAQLPLSGFSAPEMLDGDGEADPRCDIFSLGCTFYYLLTGKPPYGSERQRSQPVPLQQLRPEVPDQLAQLCARMMDDDVRQRLSRAEDVVSALQQWLEQEGVPAGDGQSLSKRRVLVAKPLTQELPDGAGSDLDAGSSFHIQTKSRKRRPDSERSGSTPAVDKRRIPLVWIVGGAAAASVVLVLVAVLLLILFFSGGQTRSSSKSLVKAPSEKAAPAGSEELEGQLESDPPLETDPEMDADAAQTAASPAQPSQPDATAGQSEGQTKPPRPSAAEEAPPQPAATSEPPKGPPPATEASQQPAPAEPPAQGADQPQTEPPQPSAAQSPPEDSSAPAGKTDDRPFRDFATLVELPDYTDATTVAELGPIYLADNDLCFVSLRGGEHAAKGSVKLALRNAANGTAERDWEIMLDGAKEFSGQTLIATLSLRDQKLLMQWKAEAGQSEMSAQLCNCVLSLNIGAQSHEVALRKPVQAEPLTLDLKKATATTKWIIQRAPDPAAMRVEITNLDGPFPKHLKNPDQPIEAVDGLLWITLGDKKEEQVLSLKLDTEMKRAFQLSVSPHFKLQDSQKPERLTPANVKKLPGVVLTAQRHAFALVEKYKQAKAPADPRQKQRFENGKRLADEALNQASLALQKVEKLAGLMEALSGVGRIQFRVFYEADGSQVDLLQANEAAP